MLLKNQEVPLPKSLDARLSLFKHCMTLSRVQEIRVTPVAFSVSRVVDDQDTVLGDPEELPPDAEFLLSRIELMTLPFDPNGHPFIDTRDAMALVTERGLRPSWLIAPAGRWVADYFDLPLEPPPRHVYGMQVLYASADATAEKLVVVGGPTMFLGDATLGVVVDLGA